MKGETPSVVHRSMVEGSEEKGKKHRSDRFRLAPSGKGRTMGRWNVRRLRDGLRMMRDRRSSLGQWIEASKGGYLVDPASSHMLVSKIKPCMSKYKLLYTVKLRMAH